MRNNILLIGKPGTGKVLWARQQARRMHPDDQAHVGRIRYAARLERQMVTDLTAPFRAPHHTVSRRGMVGELHCGFHLVPGELMLAHGGILLLDELHEFRRDVLEVVVDAVSRAYVRLHSKSDTNVVVPTSFRLIGSTDEEGLARLPMPVLKMFDHELRVEQYGPQIIREVSSG
jgi:magnesium chelatase family protein